jgi:hypothetical protein
MRERDRPRRVRWRADVGGKPSRSLSVEILGLPRESWLPLMIEIIVEIGRAGARQIEVGAIPVLAHRSAGIDPRERAHRLRRSGRRVYPFHFVAPTREDDREKGYVKGDGAGR